jgi:perosamine synthetase
MAAALPSRAERYRAEVECWLAETFHPRGWLWTDSGTSALALSLSLTSDGGHRSVALPAYGCFDLATACDAAEVRVHLYDVDPATLGPDWDSLQAALTAGAGVIVLVHLYGLPVDIDQAQTMAQSAGAIVVEDAAQGVGGAWAGRQLGSHGALSVLSFGRGKGLSAGGGGALLVHDPRFLEALPRLAQRPRGLAGVLKSAVQLTLGGPTLYSIPASLPFLGLGETIYHPPHPPTGLPSGGFGILSDTICTVRTDHEIRRRRAEALIRAAASGPLRSPRIAETGRPGWLRLPMTLPRAARSGELPRQLGIMPGYPSTLADLSGFARTQNVGGEGFPGASSIVERLVTLPTHAAMTERDLLALEEWLKRWERR